MNTIESAKEARNLTVHFIEDGRVKKTNLFDFVMKSNHLVKVDKTTCPKYTIKTTNSLTEVLKMTQDSLQVIGTFASPEAALDFLYELVYETLFYMDTTRSTTFYLSFQEAYGDLIKQTSSLYGIKYEVAVSVLKRQNRVYTLRKEREKDFIKATQLPLDMELVGKYAGMIDFIEGESYEDTARRLSFAVGVKVDRGVFHEAIKLVRRKKV